MINNFTNINKTNNHVSCLITEYNKETFRYDVWNTGHGLRQVQNCGGVKPFNWIPILSTW